MARLTEVKFGDLQADERYKKLERAMKLDLLRKRNEKENFLEPLVSSPSQSNINLDSRDGSSTNPPLRISGGGSEVISSSNNLRNTLLRKKKIHDDCNKRATSSVKNSYDKFDYCRDYILMPPPSISTPYKSTSPSSSKGARKIAKRSPRNDRSSFRVENETAEKHRDFKFPSDGGRYADNFATLQSVPTDSAKSKSGKTFVKWRVTLNAQAQLIIKGTLDCGTVVQSQPIRRRLTSTCVESVFKHLYRLQGTIVDDKLKLPDYVRGKFYDGFPDDWENVHEIWRAYVLQGCSATFRWPTPIADSDDDLRSEIMDATLRGSTSPKNAASNVTSMDSDCPSDTFQPSDSRNVRLGSCSCSREEPGRVQASATSRCDRDKNDHHHERSNARETCSRGNSDTDRLKDKFNHIMNNLNDKHCSEEYITRIIDIFDGLNYVVSYERTKGNGYETESSRSRKEQSAPEERRSDRGAFSSVETVESETIQLHQRSIDSTGAKRSNSLRRKRNFVEMSNGKTCSSADSDSESEIYAGVPKISMEHIIRQRAAIPAPRKRKTRRKGPYQTYTGSTEKISNMPSIASDCPSYAKPIRTERTNGVQLNDSSVSVVQDEDIQRNVDKRVESNPTKGRQGNKSSEPARDIDAREMQEHSAGPQDISAPAQKSTRAEAICRADASSASSENDAWYENRLPRQRFEQLSPRRKNTPSKTTKPTVINSIPVDIDIRKVSAIQDEVKTEQLNEKTRSRHSTERKAPGARSASKKVTSSLLSNSKQDPEDRVQVEAEAGKRSPRSNLKADETADIRKPKQLSAWTPRVLNQSGLHLIFKGNLMNDAGHVVHRNFQTDAVIRRVSPKLIETVRRDLYELVGDLHDSKHDVPKKLLKRCRNGCPARIEQFCQTWHELYMESNNPLASGPDVSVSSKGRKRLAPLNYWDGERVVVKENELIYNPGMGSHDSGNKGRFSKWENTTASLPEKLGRSGASKSEKSKSKEWSGIEESGGRRATGNRYARSRGSEPSLDSHATSGSATSARIKQSTARTSSPSKRTSGNDEGADARHEHRVEYAYYQVVQVTNNVLSDDQLSEM